MPSHQVVLKNAGKTFSSSGEVLRDINIEILSGDFVVLLGPSGSGKSTLLRLIAGLEDASSGTVETPQSGRFDKGFVFQEAHLMPWRTVAENTELPLELMGVSAAERKVKVENILSQVGLGTSGSLYPAELSGGMKMRTSLARALVSTPQLLLLDEPFAALDEQTRFRLGEDLRALWQKHSMTVVFVTHSLHEACFLADRVLLLSDKPGRIKKEIKIDLPKERTPELRLSPQFNEQLKKMYGAINE